MTETRSHPILQSDDRKAFRKAFENSQPSSPITRNHSQRQRHKESSQGQSEQCSFPMLMPIQFKVQFTESAVNRLDIHRCSDAMRPSQPPCQGSSRIFASDGVHTPRPPFYHCPSRLYSRAPHSRRKHDLITVALAPLRPRPSIIPFSLCSIATQIIPAQLTKVTHSAAPNSARSTRALPTPPQTLRPCAGSSRTSTSSATRR